MEFRILGPLEVLDDDKPVEIAGTKRRAVLALLLLHANEVVRTERLIDELWGEQPPRNASGALHNHVSRLRKALGAEVLARREWGYVLRADESSIDLRRFERLLAEAEPLPARQRSERLTEALRIWRGPALTDLAAEPGLETEIARLNELRLTTIERRIDADLEAGRNAELVGEIEALIAANPLREHLRWQLILSLYRAGRQAEALEVYRETRRVLTEELGLEPSPELRELEKAILRQDPAIAARANVASIAAMELPRHSTRRAALLGLIGLILLGVGVAVPFLLIGENDTHPSAAAATLTLGTSARTVATGAGTVVTTSQNTERATAPRHVHVAVQTIHPHHSARHVRRPVNAVVVHRPTRPPTVVVVRAAATKPAAAHASGNARATRRKSTRPATTNRRHTSQPPPKPVTVSDAFNGDYVDPTIWHEVKDGGDVSIVEAGGRLQLTVGVNAVPGGTYNQIDVHVGTQCSFPKSFDARVDYTLLEWPAGDNIDVGLNAIYADAAVMRDNSSQWGDGYGSWVIPRNGSVALPDTSGSLRIARVNGVETTYFWHRGSWRKLASSAAGGAAVLGLQAFSDGQNPFGGKELKVAFDNFKVSGMDAVCRPGSSPNS